jgi:hypothetical protein
MKIHIVPRELVSELWPACAPLLDAALERNPFLAVEELQRILMERAGIELLVAVDGGRIIGAAVIELEQYPTRLTGNVIALGGSAGFYERALPAMTDRLEQWCVDRGCDSISMLGRPGWTKFVSRRGWQVSPTVAAWKQLKPAQECAV